MHLLLSLVALLTTGLLRSVQCLIVQDDWTAPARPDNATVLTIGSQYTIQWTSHLWTWFQAFAPSADVSNVDLWVTGFYQHQYGHLVSQRVAVNRTTNLVWRVQIPTDELYATQYWVFRFLPSGLTFTETSDSISSPGFVVVNLTTTTSSTSSTTISSITSASSSIVATSSSLGTESTATMTATMTATVTSTPSITSTGPIPTGTTNTSTPTGLTSGAKIGIIVGAVVLAVCIAVGIVYLLRRKRVKAQPQMAIPPPSNDKNAHRYQGPPELAGNTKFNSKYHPSSFNVSELGHAGDVRHVSAPAYELSP